MNGAMILADGLFNSLTLQDMLRTFGPKVQGSILLSEMYSNQDLDFFILMGSITGPLGNRFQSAYAAANAFMSSLIQGRRARNLPGSIINPGQILGVGYVSRAGSWLTRTLLESIGCYSMAEEDLHELFAEAVLAGRPGVDGSGEIIASFKLESPIDHPDVIWYRNPKTWHFIDHWRESGNYAPRDMGSVKVQLESATTVEEAATIIEAGFAAKLCIKLELSKDVAISRDSTPMELGADSLVGLDLRTWFVREVGVDMPVLKILGGLSIGELAADGASRLFPKIQDTYVTE